MKCDTRLCLVVLRIYGDVSHDNICKKETQNESICYRSCRSARTRRNELAARGYEGIGTDIAPQYSGADDGTAVTKMPYVSLDITDRDAVEKTITELKPDVVVHCAAWTAVDLAEDDDKKAKVHAINADGTSNAKDQSYVLYRLSQQQLAASVFPLGEMTKDEIRHIAADSGLINSDKPDSQDICFVPDGDYAGFIERYTGNTYPDGDFLDENGNVIGRHKGVIFYTIGQRRGIGTGFGKPMYVIGKNADNNTVTLGESELLFTDTLYADNLNWIAFASLNAGQRHVTGRPNSRVPYIRRAEIRSGSCLMKR